MNIAALGFGNAGGKIVDTLLEQQAAADRSLYEFALAINSAEIDLAKLDRVPEKRRLLIGQTDQRVKGRGVGASPELGREIAEQDVGEIERSLDEVPMHNVDAFLVVAGLGGGTGSGGAPVIARRLREIYAEPVYGVGVLPSRDEGGRASLNAARSLPTFTEAVDNLLLFDNDNWEQAGDSIGGAYDRTNRELAQRVSTLLSPGEIDGSMVSEAAMDASDIHRTLSTGGVSTIAYAATEPEPANRNRGLIDRFRTDGVDDDDLAVKIQSLVRKAVRSRLTCPADITSAERALIVVSGPPGELSRKGLRRARQWLESQAETAEVLAGDDPRRQASDLSAAVLLSTVTEVQRVDELQDRAVDAQSSIDSQESARTNEIRDLLTDEEGELDPI